MKARQYEGTDSEFVYDSELAPDCAGRKGAHTGGKWLEEKELATGVFRQVAAFSTEGNRVLRVAIESFHPEEDARLIAAAPELLAIVQRLADGERSDEGHTAIRDAARNAVATVQP